MILNNKVSQRLEIIGFKGAVKKSTSRIQGSIEKCKYRATCAEGFFTVINYHIVSYDRVGNLYNFRFVMQQNKAYI